MYPCLSVPVSLQQARLLLFLLEEHRENAFKRIGGPPVEALIQRLKAGIRREERDRDDHSSR